MGVLFSHFTDKEVEAHRAQLLPEVTSPVTACEY